MTLTQAIEQLQDLIEVYLEKSAYQQRRQDKHRKLIRENEHKIEKASEEYGQLLQKEVMKGLPKVYRGGEKGLSKRIENEIDWEYLEEQGTQGFARPLADIHLEGVESIHGMRVLKQVGRFDPIGMDALAWAAAHGGELITGINNDLRQTINQIVRRGFDEGRSYKWVARQIEPIIPLNFRQTAKLYRNQLKMLEAGIPQDQINAWSRWYTNKAKKYRSQMIARTETAFALNEGTLNAYEKYGIRHVRWVADAGCCDVCDDLSGQIYTITQARGKQPKHPNCECCWVVARGAKAPKGVRTLADIEKNLKNKLGLNVCDLFGMDIRAAKAIEKHLLALIAKYKVKLDKIVMERLRSGAYADYWLGRIRFNSAYWTDFDKVKEMLQKDMSTHWHPNMFKASIDDLVGSVATHEYAHGIIDIKMSRSWGNHPEFTKEFSLLKRRYNKIRRDAQKRYHNNEITDTQYHKIYDESLVSRYSQKNDEELLAESFTEALYGDAPHEFSNQVLDLVEKHFGKGGK